MLDGQQATPNHGAALVLAARLERVRVEEGLAVERDAGNQAVEERPLHHVDVLGVAVQQEQPVVPVVHADRGAGLVVGGQVRQLVVAAERLADARGADAAGDVELLRDGVAPDRVDGVDIGGVAGERGDVGHAGIHVHRAHGVADRLGLLDDALLRLVVVEPAGVGALARRQRRGTALVEQELRQREVLRLAGHPRHLHQAHLGDLMAGPDRLLAGAERPHEQVGGLHGDVEQRSLAGGEMMRGRRLEQVPEVVELVAVVALEHPALRARPRDAASAG